MKVAELRTLRPGELPMQPSVGGMAEIASILGDPARMSMLCSLAQEGTLPARELAIRAGVTPQTASGHIAKLLAAGLVMVERRGRERLHRLADGDVGDLLSIVNHFASRTRPTVVSSNSPGILRTARCCYDHLAGRVATGWAQVLVAEPEGREASLTSEGRKLLGAWGGTAMVAENQIRCSLCDDWTEAQPHIGGALGAAMLSRALELDWVRRLSGSRALIVTHAGRSGLRDVFGFNAT